MNVLLTSAGLESKEIQEGFLTMLGKEPGMARALFIPTAAIDADAVEVLPKCMNDLLKSGIPKERITVFDLHCSMSEEALRAYDVVYLCGGSTKYLLSRIRETGFDAPLLAYMREGGLVVGVSAGSLLFSNHVPGHLELLDARLEVHCAQGERPGRLAVPPKSYLKLTNTRALVIRSVPDDMEIIGA